MGHISLYTPWVAQGWVETCSFFVHVCLLENGTYQTFTPDWAPGTGTYQYVPKTKNMHPSHISDFETCLFVESLIRKVMNYGSLPTIPSKAAKYFRLYSDFFVPFWAHRISDNKHLTTSLASVCATDGFFVQSCTVNHRKISQQNDGTRLFIFKGDLSCIWKKKLNSVFCIHAKEYNILKYLKFYQEGNAKLVNIEIKACMLLIKWVCAVNKCL